MRNEIMRRRVRTMLMLQAEAAGTMTAMNLGPYAAFIVGAYGAAALIVTAMIAWVVIDHRRQARALADLEARGVTRRSERAARRGDDMSATETPDAGKRGGASSSSICRSRSFSGWRCCSCSASAPATFRACRRR